MDERAWARTYLTLLREAYRRRMASTAGDWPKISELERWAAQQDLDVDVTEVYRAMPDLPGQQRRYHAEFFIVPLRLLRFLPEADDLLAVCLGITQIAAARYLDPDVETPRLSNDDADLAGLATDSELTYFAGLLLSNEAFAPIGGGSYGDGSWQFGIDERWMKRYRGVESVEELFARQLALAQLFAAERSNANPALTSLLAESVDAPSEEFAVEDVAAVAAADFVVSEVAAPPAATYEYDVALSFAGEDREFVEAIAKKLAEVDIKAFYDNDNLAQMWGEELTEYLDEVYRLKSRYTMVFISKHYAEKPWARHERRSALSRAVTERGAYILPIRLDDTELEGLRPSVAYLDARNIGINGIVAAIRQKLSGSSPPTDIDVSRVPRNPNEMHNVREYRPPGWEYLLFIGALLHGRDSLEEKYRDHALRYGPPSGAYVDAAEIGGFCRQQLAYCRALVDAIGVLMNDDNQIRAFGAPGEPGDAEMIMQLARRLTEHYQGFLDWAREVRGVSTEEEHRGLLRRLAEFANQPVESYRSFVDDAVQKGDVIPGHAKKSEAERQAEPLVVDMIYKVDIPDDVLEAFSDEIGRLS